MEIKSWATGVNRTILNETTITIGQNAVQNSNSENGTEQSLLRSSGVPDQYSVSMYFSNSTKNAFYLNHVDNNGNHITEWQAFLRWFKYEIEMGTLPFYFASIGDVSGNTSAIYKIISSGIPKGTPEGEYIKCSMTWAEVINETMNYSQERIVGDYLDFSENIIEFHFTEVPSEIPKKSDFTVSFSIDNENINYIDIEYLEYDGYKTCILMYSESVLPSKAIGENVKFQVSYAGTTISGYYAIPKKEI